jgi:hypothetical protein
MPSLQLDMENTLENDDLVIRVLGHQFPYGHHYENR